MNKLILFVSTILIAASVATTQVQAAGESTCQPIYGGGEVCPPSIKFTLDKKVQNPSTGGFEDNITASSSTRFAPAADITFQLVVTNTGNETLENVTVTDKLPQGVTFVSSQGTYDQNANTVTIKINSLEAGKSQKFTITAKANAEGKMAQDTVCLVNEARATEGRGATASDNAQFCIAKTGVPGKGGPVVQPPVKVTKTPETGPEMLSLLALIPTGAAGLILRRKSHLK